MTSLPNSDSLKTEKLKVESPDVSISEFQHLSISQGNVSPSQEHVSASQHFSISAFPTIPLDRMAFEPHTARAQARTLTQFFNTVLKTHRLKS
jgi:hypothetical protein